MQIEVKTISHIVFTVESFVGTEGGMDCSQYGGESEDIAEAVDTLRQARASEARMPKDKQTDWLIVGRVKTLTSKIGH